MKLFVCLCVCAFATAQLGGLGDLLDQLRGHLNTGTGEGATLDTLHDWRVEYHFDGDHHVLLFIKDELVQGHRYCYVVEVATSWEPLLQDKLNVQRISDEIYALLKDPNHEEHQLRPSDLGTVYHHFDAARECRGHDTYSVNYTPSFVTPITSS